MVDVIFLKDHNEFKKGDEANLEDGLANYLQSVGVVEKTGKKEQEKDYDTKEDKTVNTRKKK